LRNDATSRGGWSAEKVETTQERWAEAENASAAQNAIAGRGDHGAVEDSYQEGLALARRQSAKFWELRAALDPRLWCGQSKREDACHLLAPIYAWFTEGFNTPVLQDAKVLLDQLT
jgi:predicted ATPase